MDKSFYDHIKSDLFLLFNTLHSFWLVSEVHQTPVSTKPLILTYTEYIPDSGKERHLEIRTSRGLQPS